MRKLRPALGLALIIPLTSCYLFWTAPGSTRADAGTQRMIRSYIGSFEAGHGGSNPPNIVATRVVRTMGYLFDEIWVVDRNGTRVEYEVQILATGFSVKNPGK